MDHVASLCPGDLTVRFRFLEIFKLHPAIFLLVLKPPTPNVLGMVGTGLAGQQ